VRGVAIGESGADNVNLVLATTDPDSDGDGLLDSEEATLGTNPSLVDTDGDGLMDGDSGVVSCVTGPLCSGGYLLGEQDIDIATNPTDADSDNDGINDGIEVAADTDPNDYTKFPSSAYGDINMDNVVDIRDVLLATRALSGDKILTPEQQARADVAPLVADVPTPDGQFNAGDLVVIQRMAMGQISF
jgi:hypothetical protein